MGQGGNARADRPATLPTWCSAGGPAPHAKATPNKKLQVAEVFPYNRRPSQGVRQLSPGKPRS